MIWQVGLPTTSVIYSTGWIVVMSRRVEGLTSHVRYLIDLIELLTFSLAAIFTDLHCQINHPMTVLFLK